MSQRVGVKPPNNRLATGGTRKKMKTPGGRFAHGVSSGGNAWLSDQCLCRAAARTYI
jgi:hypothetical protein